MRAAAIVTVIAAAVLALPDIAGAGASPARQATEAVRPTLHSADASRGGVNPDAGVGIPAEVPSKRTPWVLGGEVNEIVQVGDTMIAGGQFSRVSDPLGATHHKRKNLFAFDATTGQVSTTFDVSVNGEVKQLLPGPTPGTVYVAGDFTKINGAGPSHLQLLHVDTGRAVRSFRAPATNGEIETIELLPRNRLFIGGTFTRLGREPHGQLASLDARSGMIDPFIDLTTTGHHNTGPGARAPIGPREAGVTPAGDRLIVTGNFRKVGRRHRDQIVMIDLTRRHAEVSSTWATSRYTPLCSRKAFASYLRDVEVSPDGSFIVVSSTGGRHPGTLCDTAARFETYAVGTDLAPTWVASSGGDTLWGLAITESAVYVGGHNRWMNNPNGSNRAGQGAVPRPGLSALDPESGIPLAWNPGRNPRGEAAYDFAETDTGVWVVSNTAWIGDRRYRRRRIAFFPYAGGYQVASKSTATLPGSVYVGAPVAATGTDPGAAATAAVIDFDGTAVTAQTLVNTGSFDWTEVRTAMMVGSTLFYGQTDGMLYRRTFDGTDFGAPSAVNPYQDSPWSTVNTGSGPPGQTYEGALPRWYGQLSTLTGMFYADSRIYYTRRGEPFLFWRWFSPDSGIVSALENTVVGRGAGWGTTRGMFLDGSTLYVVSDSGDLLRIGFVDGATTGVWSVADASIDWRGNAVFLASVIPTDASRRSG